MGAVKMERLENVFLFEYNEFDNLVSDVYGQEYDFVADEELSNDSVRFYRDITGKEIDDYDRKKVETFRETGEGSFLSRSLLEDLCSQGKIEPGNYLVSVSW